MVPGVMHYHHTVEWWTDNQNFPQNFNLKSRKLSRYILIFGWALFWNTTSEFSEISWNVFLGWCTTRKTWTNGLTTKNFGKILIWNQVLRRAILFSFPMVLSDYRNTWCVQSKLKLSALWLDQICQVVSWLEFSDRRLLEKCLSIQT